MIDFNGLYRKSRLLLFIFAVNCCLSAIAQNPARKYLSHELGEKSLSLRTSDGNYVFTPYSSEILETAFIPEGENYDEDSHAVILKPQQVSFEVTEDTVSVKLSTEGIEVIIVKQPFQVSYFYNGEKVISEKQGFYETEEHQVLDFNIEEYELLFGGGARALGMNRRGNRLELYNRAHYGYETRSELLNYTLPVVFSSEKYMIHFDNAPIGYLDLDSEHSNRLAYAAIGGRKTYQLIVGRTWEKIVENYTLLTGRQPLPPRWTFGNFSSRFGYHSRQEVEATIQKFREDTIPVDAVILDLYWFGHEIQGTMGNLEFVRDSFPEPEKMMSDLLEDGVKSILVTEPFILTTSKKWEEAVEKEVLATDAEGNPFIYDFYFGNTGLIDIFKPSARDWFWNIYRELTEMGVAGWWGDLGEPEVHPSALKHYTGSADEVHNIYGHHWAKMIYKGYQEDFPGRRPFILMRAGAAGSQRFGLIPWSGDVNRSWGGLKPQPEISLQMGIQGLAYMHSDLGGFAGDLRDDELYTRWLQYGVFQPVYRPHAQEEVASEPVFKQPKTKALAKAAIELRYRMLPYNYSLAFQNSRTGIPLMRPLFFEEPENYRIYNISNTYLWGNNFLVSPVVNPNISSKEVYFPAGSNWFDFYTGKRFKGGAAQRVELQEESIPVYVRGGAFVPMAKLVQTTADYSASDLELHFYFDKESAGSTGEVYHDDGQTAEAYEKGLYEILHLKSANERDSVTLEFRKETGQNFTSEIKELELVVHNLEKKPSRLEANGRKLSAFVYSGERKELRFRVQLQRETSIITVKLK